jgi:hypothetical protein
MMTLGLFATLEVVLSSAVEPWLYGAHTGLSSLAILISAAFWTLLWGPIGLILSTPLTVCLLVVGRYVPALSSLAVLLGDQPVLPPEACYYQRLLAGDEDEAHEIAMAYLKDHTVSELYDAVLIPALALAERDRHDVGLDEERADFIYQSSKALIEDLDVSVYDNGHDPSGASIVCLPARDNADELAALMLCQTLRQAGHSAVMIPIGPMEEMFHALKEAEPALIFVSALPPLALSHARAMCRLLQQSFRGTKIIVGIWNSPADKLKAEERWARGTYDSLIVSLHEAESLVQVPVPVEAERGLAEPLRV